MKTKNQVQSQSIRAVAKDVYVQFAEQYGVGRFRQRKAGEYRFTVDFVGAFVFNDEGVWIRQRDGKTDHLVSITDGYINLDFDHFTLLDAVPLTAAILTSLTEHGFTCKSDDVKCAQFIHKMAGKITVFDFMRLAADLADYAGLEGDAVRYMGLDGITVQGPDYRLFMQVGGVSLTVKMFAYGQSDWSEYLNIFDEDRDCLIDSIDYLNEEFVDECKSRYETDLLIEELEQLNQIAA
ncbi:hypothetical protein [Aeromonas salmonicida]